MYTLQERKSEDVNVHKQIVLWDSPTKEVNMKWIRTEFILMKNAAHIFLWIDVWSWVVVNITFHDWQEYFTARQNIDH